MGWHHQTANHASPSIRIPSRGEEKEAQDTTKVNIMLMLRYLLFFIPFFIISVRLTSSMLMLGWFRSLSFVFQDFSFSYIFHHNQFLCQFRPILCLTCRFFSFFNSCSLYFYSFFQSYHHCIPPLMMGCFETGNYVLRWCKWLISLVHCWLLMVTDGRHT